MIDLKNKKFVIIGDRDGIPGDAIAECIKTIEGAKVLFSTTECFVWTAAGSMDLEVQKRIKDFAEKHDKKDLVVVLGAAEDEATGIAAETVISGDPTFAGVLANVALGLTAVHACEEAVKSAVNADVYEEQIAMMEMVLDVPAIEAELKEIRG